ncbi:antirestriction protein ArdA [Acrocarpospora sp. B8E8]|uniref:antirestriction protein ArdA n=1 Tax=Acrocarpospora sp. B8E8 TaxID=3153572 RepID=UPI00325F1D4F
MLTMTSASTIKVHFWNLGAYVSGSLVGGWIDLDYCVDFEDFAGKVLDATRNAEEVILGDYESDFGISFSEYQGLEAIWAVHEALCEIHESEREPFGDYLAYIGGVDYLDTAISDWQDHYCGQFKSIEDYAWSFAEDVYPDLANMPPGFRVEVDTVAWECDHWISANGHVFSS